MLIVSRLKYTLSVGQIPRICLYKRFDANPFILIEKESNAEEYLNLGTL